MSMKRGSRCQSEQNFDVMLARVRELSGELTKEEVKLADMQIRAEKAEAELTRITMPMSSVIPGVTQFGNLPEEKI